MKNNNENEVYLPIIELIQKLTIENASMAINIEVLPTEIGSKIIGSNIATAYAMILHQILGNFILNEKEFVSNLKCIGGAEGEYVFQNLKDALSLTSNIYASQAISYMECKPLLDPSIGSSGIANSVFFRTN